MPTPRDGESRDDFLDRCMSDNEAVNDFPDTDQRFAFCNSVWEQNKEQGKMNKKIYKPFNIEVKDVSEETREIVAIGSQQKADRDGDIIKVDGIDIRNYKKNPVVLWSHNHSDPPIGRASKIWKDGKKLMFKIQYADPETYSFADTIYKLTKNGYINAFSIGFVPNWDDAIPNEKTGGYTFNKSELLEVSAVNIPANPVALVESRSIKKALEDEVIDDAEYNEMKIYLEELIIDKEEQDDLEEIEKFINEFEEEEKEWWKLNCEEYSPEEDEIEKESNENEEQTINEDSCPHCGRKYKEQEEDDSDPFAWLFKDHKVEEPKDDTTDDLVDELLNKLNNEV
jgi:HK97 family phage prohead protease